MFRAFLHQLDELHLVARASRAVAAKTAIRIRLWINMQRWRFVRMEGTVQPVVIVLL